MRIFYGDSDNITAAVIVVSGIRIPCARLSTYNRFAAVGGAGRWNAANQGGVGSPFA